MLPVLPAVVLIDGAAPGRTSGQVTLGVVADAVLVEADTAAAVLP
jgi:hypothetical protein